MSQLTLTFLTPLLAFTLSSQDALPSDPVFEVLTIDGARREGALTALNLAPSRPGSLVLAGPPGPGAAIPLNQIVAVSRKDTSSAAPAPDTNTHLILLPEGDRLRAVATEADAAALKLALGGAADQIRAPLDRLVGIILAPPADPVALARLVARVRDPARADERAWLTNGDVVAGSFAGLDAQHARFNIRGAETIIPRDRVETVAFDPSLLEYPRPKHPFLEIGLADGSRLGAVACSIDQGRLKALTRLGPEVELPLKSVSYLHVLGGSVDFLAQRTPAAAQFIPYLDKHPGVIGRDATWDGQTPFLGGRIVEHGLGMLPRTLAAYRIEPGDTRFQADAGLDDRCGEHASVVFRVLVDREEVFSSPPVTPGDPPIPIDVSLQNGQLLILVVEFGERGDVHDSAIWAMARIIRATGSRE